MAAICSRRRTPRMRHVVRATAVVALASGLLDVTHATQTPIPARTPIDVSALGPQVGQRVPEFDLKDQHGKAWTLKSILGPQGAMLVFFRSADW